MITHRKSFIPKLGLLACIMVFWGQPVAWAQFANRSYGSYEDTAGVRHTGYFDFAELDRNLVLFFAGSRPDVPVRLTPQNTAFIEADEDILIRTHTIAGPYITENEDRILVEETLFISRIAAGPIQLYEGHSKREGILYFLNTVDHPELRRVNKKATRTFFKHYFPDCAAYLRGAHSYDRTSILRAIQSIQQCAYRDRAVARSQSLTSPLYFDLGGQLFFFTGAPIVSGMYEDGTYDRINRWGAGLAAQLNFSTRTALRIGMNYIDKRIGSSSVRLLRGFGQGSYTYLYNDPIELDYKLLEMPLAVHYVFGHNPRILSPTIAAGMSLAYPLRQEVLSDFTTPKNVSSGAEEASIDFREMRLESIIARFFLSAGFTKRLENEAKLEFLLTYSEDQEAFNTRLQADNRVLTRRLMLSLVYMLPLNK